MSIFKVVWPGRAPCVLRFDPDTVNDTLVDVCLTMAGAQAFTASKGQTRCNHDLENATTYLLAFNEPVTKDCVQISLRSHQFTNRCILVFQGLAVNVC